MTDQDVLKRTIPVGKEHIELSVERQVKSEKDYERYILGYGSKTHASHDIIPGVQMFTILDNIDRKYAPSYIGSVSGIDKEGRSWSELMELMVLGGTYEGKEGILSGEKILGKHYAPLLSTICRGQHDAGFNTWSGEIYATDHVFGILPKFKADGSLEPGQYAKDIEHLTTRPLLTMPLRAIKELKYDFAEMKTLALKSFGDVLKSTTYIGGTTYEKFTMLMSIYEKHAGNNDYLAELDTVYQTLGNFNIPKHSKFDHCYLGVASENAKPGHILKLTHY